MHDRRDSFPCVRAAQDIEVGGCRLDVERVGREFDADQLLYPCQVDDVGRRGQPLLHDRDQGVTAGEVFGIGALCEQRGGFVYAGGPMINRLVHDSFSLFDPARVLSARAASASPRGVRYALPGMACQTRSGVAGISSRLLPIASVIALMTAADAPIAPASPQPLTPSGLPGQSVVVWFSLNEGRSSARGIV